MDVVKLKNTLDLCDVELVKKTDDWLMSLIGKIVGGRFMYMWTTYRLPFCRPRICYPPMINDPINEAPGIIEHELVHVMQFYPASGPFMVALFVSIFPLPMYFSGRWFIERRAYLQDIISNRRTVDDCIFSLWENYAKPWPKPLMRAWFNKELKRLGHGV